MPKLMAKFPPKSPPQSSSSPPEDAAALSESEESDLERAIQDSLMRVDSTVGTTVATRAWLDEDFKEGDKEQGDEEEERVVASSQQLPPKSKLGQSRIASKAFKKDETIQSASSHISSENADAASIGVRHASVRTASLETGSTGSPLRRMADASTSPADSVEPIQWRSIGVSTPRSSRPSPRLPRLSKSEEQLVYRYPVPQEYCNVCGTPHLSTQVHRHFSLEQGGAGSYRQSYDQYDPTFEQVDYGYGTAAPNKLVKIIERRDCLGGLIQWDETYTGRIIGHEWAYRGPKRQQPTTWYPLLLYYQSFE